MKLSLALATLATMAPAVVAIPDGLVEQCCVLDTTGAGLGLGELHPDLPTTIKDQAYTAHDNIAGYAFLGGDNGKEDLCTAGCGGRVSDGPGTWTSYSLLQVCTDLISGGDHLGPAASGEFLDCKDSSGGHLSDAPWTCAVAIAAYDIDLEEMTGGQAGFKGYYCGRLQPCKEVGSVCGDPHFQTWDGEWFDFHGECDMTFLSEPQFGKGLGLEVQIRSKARYEYSFIESAAIKIGDDVLEVSSYGQYFFNGVSSAKLAGIKMAGLYDIEYTFQDKKTSIFHIIIGEGVEGKETIEIKTFKDLVSVRMIHAYENTFTNAKGMMGDYHTGEKLARDGKTVIEDAIEFGMEWQVRPEEPKLFQSDRSPQLSNGEKCIMPSKTASAERRRLGETISLEAAVAACEAVDHVHHENCVYDIMATGDIEIAHAGVF